MADELLAYRAALYLAVLIVIIAAMIRIEMAKGNGGRKPLRYLLVALLLSNLDLPLASLVKATPGCSGYSVWVFVVNGILVIFTMAAFLKYKH